MILATDNKSDKASPGENDRRFFIPENDDGDKERDEDFSESAKVTVR